MEVNKCCRICGSKDLRPFLDLGEMALANSFVTKDKKDQIDPVYPLRVFWCQKCNHCQLGEVVSGDVMFRDYIYFSSGMPALPKHFQNYADDVMDRFLSSKNDLVIELGSNDGILLRAFKDKGYKILGIDPALNIAKLANKNGIKTIPDFFSEKLAKQIKKQYGAAKIIMGNNVVAHIDDHHDLARGVKHLLSKKGVFVFEAPYLVDMFENLTYDTIYHEHLSYLAVRPLVRLFKEYNLEIFDVRIFPVQGQSIRVFVGHKNEHLISKNVKDLIKKEKLMELDQYKTYQKLAERIMTMKAKVRKLLKRLKSQNKSIAGYGAPAKGNTLLNFYGVGPDTLDYLTEELPSKIGLYSPGQHIPVIDLKDARKNPPDYYLMLAWNYKDAILQKEEEYRRKGGKFIIPVGLIEVI